MRWNNCKAVARPKCGDRRMVTRFLLLPKTMGGECRWLEVASWQQEFQVRVYSDFYSWDWHDLREEGWSNETI